MAVEMIPAGYLAKRVEIPARWDVPSQVADIYSLSDCANSDFADYIEYWKHNGYWLFDSPELIREVARDAGASLDGTHLFYYEVYPFQFDGSGWAAFAPEASFPTNVLMPSSRELNGFDVVTFWAGSSPEHSPLSCNGLAKEIETNSHCLFETFDKAKTSLDRGLFKDAEPGPYRIFSVNSVPWPSSSEKYGAFESAQDDSVA